MSNKPATRLGERLVAAGKISERDLERALLAQQEMGDLLGRVLIRLGLVSEQDVVQALAAQGGYPLLSAIDFPEEPLWLDGLALDFLLNHNILPIGINDGRLRVAMSVPQDAYVLKALQLAVGMPVDPSIATETDIGAALKKLLEENIPADETADGTSEGYLSDNEFIEHLKDLASEAPVIRLVNQIIREALDRRASDIHIEPFEGGLQIRYRVDGVMHDGDAPPASLAPAITSRIKLLARLNIAERRMPQDGRIMTRVKGHELDLRVSTMPTMHGESVVMRILDRQSIRLNLEEMGFSPDILTRYQKLIHQPHGILLVTGPTGSGKTTTLYASLAQLDAHTLKILTVEDPVEYQLPGVNQVQVQPQIGLNFAHVLRSMLRQDPDIIMIGEMRDGETAQIAVQAALTGHLVLSTLHTNTAVGAIVRLEDMGVERYLITSTINGVLAQRLIRKLCMQCRRPHQPTDAELEETGLKRFMPHGATIYRAGGCPACGGTGYRGRMAIHELFVMDEGIHKAILEGADATTLHTIARHGGMLTLMEDGLRKVAAGLTSVEEVLRVAKDGEHA